jgi:hypothetical protein
MRTLAIAAAVLTLAACSKADDATLYTASPAAAVVTPAAPTMADVAGTWDMKTLPETGDSVLTTFRLQATGDTAGWTMTFPNRDPIPMTVVARSADSVVAEAGPYDSQLRAGQKVHIISVMRMQGDRLVSRTTAHYLTGGKTDTVMLRTEGVRAP